MISFFMFIKEEPGVFHGLDTLLFYIRSSLVICGMGLVFIGLSFMKKLLGVRLNIFLLVMTCTLNVFCALLFVLLSFQGWIRVETYLEMLVPNLVIAVSAGIIVKKLSEASDPSNEV